MFRVKIKKFSVFKNQFNGLIEKNKEEKLFNDQKLFCLKTPIFSEIKLTEISDATLLLIRAFEERFKKVISIWL